MNGAERRDPGAGSGLRPLPPEMSVRRLAPRDAADFLAVRREALASDPAAFSASPATDRALEPGFAATALAMDERHAVFGAFREAELVGIAGVYQMRNEKEAHKALLWGMFVRPDARRAGLARALLRSAIDHARAMPGVTHLHLSVSESARSACRLYVSEGFSTWGVEPAGLVVGGVRHTVLHMVLALEGAREFRG